MSVSSRADPYGCAFAVVSALGVSRGRFALLVVALNRTLWRRQRARRRLQH